MPLSLLKEPHFIAVVFPDKQERPEEQGPHPIRGGRLSLRSVFGGGGDQSAGSFPELREHPHACSHSDCSRPFDLCRERLCVDARRGDHVVEPWRNGRGAPSQHTGAAGRLCQTSIGRASHCGPVWTAVSVAASGVCGVSTPQLGLLRVDVRPRASEQFIQSYARLHEGSTLPPLPPSHYTES